MSNLAEQTLNLSTLFRAPGAIFQRGRAFAQRTRTSPPPPLPVPARDITVAREMTFTRTDTGSECRLQIAGALDMTSAPQLRAVFDSIVAARPQQVILDLEELTMIDSSGVGAIVSLFKRVNAVGGNVVVKGVQHQPLAVCKLLKLDRVFGLRN